MPDRILVIDDERDIRGLICGILEDEGYDTAQGKGSDDLDAYLADHPVPALVILDIWLEGSALDGLQILSLLKKRYPFLPVIMISGHGTVETAVAAIKDGAYDFIEKPFKAGRLLLMVQRAIEAASLKQENHQLRAEQDDVSKAANNVLPFDGRQADYFMRCALKEARQQFERDYLIVHLNRFKGNVSKTAAFVGMDRAALHRKMKSLSIVVEDDHAYINADEVLIATSEGQV